MTRLVMGFCALLLAVLVSALIGWRLLLRWLVAPAAPGDRHAVVVVPEHAKAEDLAPLLAHEGLVRDPKWLATYLARFREPFAVRPGEYALAATMSPVEMVDRIEHGVVVTYTVTIPPGARASKIVSLLAEQGLSTRAELEALLQDKRLPRRLGLPSDSLEGYLFPDTYALPKGMSGAELMGQMVARYRKAVTPALLVEAKASGLGEEELMALASLIEADKVPEDERARVSAVYHNRIKAGLKLENPASVAYGLGKDAGALTQRDLDDPHPWNTYVHHGLPPTPIASPSLESIEAAARPAKSDALYFAPSASGDATHVFCPDVGCYRVAVDRWQKEQRGLRDQPRH